MAQVETFTTEDLMQACDDLALLPYFPIDGRAAIMRLLAAMCPHKEALLWLVSETINHVKQWPGPAELRGLLCTRYDPADGVDAWCSMPGFTAEEAEARHIEQSNALKAGGWEMDRLKSIGYTPDRLKQLPAVEEIPAKR